MPEYNLARMLRQAGVRVDVTLPPIVMTRAMERELEAIIREIVETWRGIVNEGILPVYASALVSGQVEALTRALERASSLMVPIRAGAAVSVAAWTTRVDRWHRQTWGRQIEARGVNAFPFIDIRANSAEIVAMQARITSLIRSIDERARADVADAVWRNFVAQAPRAQLAAQIRDRLGVSRSRARLIAIDQANKVSAELTKLRQQEAGIEWFEWETVGDDRVRETHAELHGQQFRWDEPPSIGLPGTEVNCRCTGRAIARVSEESNAVAA